MSKSANQKAQRRWERKIRVAQQERSRMEQEFLDMQRSMYSYGRITCNLLGWGR